MENKERGKQPIDLSAFNRRTAIVDHRVLRLLVNSLETETLEEFKSRMINGIRDTKSREEIVLLMGDEVAFAAIVKSVKEEKTKETEEFSTALG